MSFASDYGCPHPGMPLCRNRSRRNRDAPNGRKDRSWLSLFYQQLDAQTLPIQIGRAARLLQTFITKILSWILKTKDLAEEDLENKALTDFDLQNK
jgi:hypothetical protein